MAILESYGEKPQSQKRPWRPDLDEITSQPGSPSEQLAKRLKQAVSLGP